MEISINIDGIFQDLITDNGNHFSSIKGLFVAGKYECEKRYWHVFIILPLSHTINNREAIGHWHEPLSLTFFLYKKRYTIKKTSDMVRFIHKLHVIFNEHWCLMCRWVYEEGKHKSITVTLKSYILMYIWWFCGYLDNVYMSKLILWRN